MPEIRGRDIRLMLIGGVLGVLGAIGGLGALGAMVGLGSGGMAPLSPAAHGEPCGLSTDRTRAYFGRPGAVDVAPGTEVPEDAASVCDRRSYDEEAFVPLRCRRALALPGGVAR